MEKFNKLSKMGIYKTVGAKMGKAIFFSKVIIITCLVPIFAFQKVEGKMFSPLAYTLGFALLGAITTTLTLVPVLASILLNKNVREKHNPIVHFINGSCLEVLLLSFKHKRIVLIISGAYYSNWFILFQFSWF